MKQNIMLLYKYRLPANNTTMLVFPDISHLPGVWKFPVRPTFSPPKVEPTRSGFREK